MKREYPGHLLLSSTHIPIYTQGCKVLPRTLAWRWREVEEKKGWEMRVNLISRYTEPAAFPSLRPQNCPKIQGREILCVCKPAPLHPNRKPKFGPLEVKRWPT